MREMTLMLRKIILVSAQGDLGRWGGSKRWAGREKRRLMGMSVVTSAWSVWV